VAQDLRKAVAEQVQFEPGISVTYSGQFEFMERANARLKIVVPATLGIIFVLLVFVLAQAFLSVALSGRDRQLDRLGRQMAEISDMLALERGRTAELQLSIAGLNKDVTQAQTARDQLSQQLTALGREQARVAAERDSLRQERDRLTARLADADLQARSALTRNEALQQQLTEIAKRGDTASQAAGANATLAAAMQDRLASTQAALTTAQKQLTESQDLARARAAEAAANLEKFTITANDLVNARNALAATQAKVEEMKQQIAALDQTVRTDKATIEARISDLAKLSQELRALTALRDALEREAQNAAVRATTEQQRREAVAAQLAEEQRLSTSARAQMALLMQQAGIEVTLVPYNGNQPSITALLRGDVDLASDSLFATRAPMEAGQIKPIALSSPQRLATHPSLPTFAETLPGYAVMFWGGLLAPRGTPPAVIEAMNAATNKALAKPAVAERVRSFGAEPGGGTPDDYTKLIASDWQRWAPVVAAANIKAD
jgi:septal ring factor EnvC (AmiA/AmiB activator)